MGRFGQQPGLKDWVRAGFTCTARRAMLKAMNREVGRCEMETVAALIILTIVRLGVPLVVLLGIGAWLRRRHMAGL
jgi:hypothetical protein